MNVKKMKADCLNSPVVAADNCEPLIFRRRRGNGPARIGELYEVEHTERPADGLKEAGVTLPINTPVQGLRA